MSGGRQAVAVAETLASRGYRVLVIDADHQCTAGAVLLGEARGEKADRQERTLHDLLGLMMRLDFDRGTFGSLVIAGEGGADWKTRRAEMARWLRATFDFTIIDCPPSFTLYRVQVDKHRNIVSPAKRRAGRLADLPLPFDTVIPNAAALAAACDPDHQFATLRQKYSPTCATLYESLCDEILERLDSPRAQPDRAGLRDRQRPSLKAPRRDVDMRRACAHAVRMSRMVWSD